MQVTSLDKCPCCSNKTYGECCERFINQQHIPATPLELMRSRYTAFVLKNADYLEATAAGKALEIFDRDAVIKETFSKVEWTKLEILATSNVNANDTLGFVEFKAHFVQNGETDVLQENSKFQKIHSKWFYVGGVQKNLLNTSDVQTGDIKTGDTKIGRNDPCGCGSGKKYKKCCGK